jgi:threonine dehydrogenase-like Zn-dependent dehydrogenase
VKALTFQAPRRLAVEEVEDPRIVEPTDVIVRVERAAICGSDLHVYHGREQGLDAGCVMGHEFVGRVVAAGRDVVGLDPGRSVYCPFTTSCGRCFYCREGLTSRCVAGQLFGWVQGGSGLHGGQAELVRVPLADATLLPIPEGVSADEALLLGDVLSTGYFCAEQAGVEPDGVYVVLGCGPVGLCAILGAREHGARNVFAVDRVAERLSLAVAFGAATIDSSVQDPREVLDEATEGRGADAVLEAVGSPSAHRLAFDLVRPGGTVAVVGVHNEPGFGFTPAEAYDKNLTYRVGRCPARRLMEQLIPLVQRREYDLTSLISHRLDLSRGVEAYRIFDEKLDGCVKVVLTP